MYKHARQLAKFGVITLGLSGLGSAAVTEDHDPGFIIKAAARSTRMISVGVWIMADYQYSLYNPFNKITDPDLFLERKTQVHQRSADRLLRAILASGGVYIKLGQHVASLDHLLPNEYVKTMKVLQDRCLASDINEIKSMFMRDMGTRIEDMFLEFNPVPIGVASLAQVHRATLRNGQEVAVKCQHPSIRKFSLLDIELTSRFVLLIKTVFPQFEFDWLAHEMRENLPLELDFKHEAQNADRVRTNFHDSNHHPSRFSRFKVKIPLVYWAEDRILCMEFCEGNRIDDVEYMHQNNIHPRQVGCELTRLFSEMIFKHGFLHADPHPGNLLIHAIQSPRTSIWRQGLWYSYFWRPRRFEIVLLDHGLYRTLDMVLRISYAQLWTALIHQDERAIQHWCKALAPHVDMYALFVCMLTGRSWQTITSSTGIKSTPTAIEVGQISEQAGAYVYEIASVLAQLPRPLLLVFKTNDLLRSVYRSLNLSEWVSISLFSVSGFQLILTAGNVNRLLGFRYWFESVFIQGCVVAYEYLHMF